MTCSLYVLTSTDVVLDGLTTYNIILTTQRNGTCENKIRENNGEVSSSNFGSMADYFFEVLILTRLKRVFVSQHKATFSVTNTNLQVLFVLTSI
jgi:hypothetical protein